MHNETYRFEQYFTEYISRGITGGAPWKCWNYKDDIIITGVHDLFCATGDIFYRNAIIQMVKGKYPDKNNNLEYNLDKISSAKTDLIMEKVTGKNRYHERYKQKMAFLNNYPRTKSGNFWHKDIYPNQVWLDGMYMVMPSYIQDLSNVTDVLNQYESVRTHLYNKEIGLYFHAWDESKREKWANKKSGISPNAWLRAMGWLLMSFVDCYDFLTYDYQKQSFCELYNEAIEGIMKYQDERTKMFYQLVDIGPQHDKNYLETSGSAMVAYSLMKSSRIGMSDKKNFAIGKEILEGIAQEYLTNDGEYHLNGICGSAGLGAGPDNRTDRDGSVEYYLSEKQKVDNQHGVAACMMAYSEWLYGDRLTQ